jgi:hypothetical protein
VKFAKFAFALFLLLPMALIATAAAWRLFGPAMAVWARGDVPAVGWFALGGAVWTLAFFVFPRPLWIYVFGHEATHAMMAWLCGGRVSGFKVSQRGGSVRTDRTNALVVLAPYFVPFYSVMVVWIWWLASFWLPQEMMPDWALAWLLGVSWGFHVTFTLWMIPQVQPDITSEGWFFSLNLIYLMNLLIVAGGLAMATPGMGWSAITVALRGGLHDILRVLVLGLSYFQDMARFTGL